MASVDDTFETEAMAEILESLNATNIDARRKKYLATNLLPTLFEALPKLLRAVEKNPDILFCSVFGKLENVVQIKAKINAFEDIVQLANQENEIELKYDLERNVKLVSFKNGSIDISFNEKLNKNFTKILTEKLFSWTGERWIISLNKKIGEKTIFEKKNEIKNIQLKEAKKNEKIKILLETFDDADLVNVQKEES